MKILFIISALGSASGAEHVLADYLKSEPRIDPYFLILGVHTEAVKAIFSPLADQSHIRLIECTTKIQSTLSRIALYRAYRFKLCHEIKHSIEYRELQNLKFDIIYYNNSFEASVFYSLFPGNPKIVHIHDMIDMFRPAQKECVVSVCKKAKQILTVSEACKTMLIANGVNEASITVAHNSLEMKPIPYSPSVDSGALTIGFVGSAIQRKGFDLLIDILNELRQRVTADLADPKTISLLIVTNSPKGSSYIHDCLTRLSPDIQIHEYYGIPRNDVLALYRKMDLLLVPSRFDPLPTVVLEAYMAGVPVLGTAKDGMLEMQVDSRMMFAKENVPDAVMAIQGWLSLPEQEQRETVNKTQLHICRRFTAQNKKDKVYDAITKIMKGREYNADNR